MKLCSDNHTWKLLTTGLHDGILQLVLTLFVFFLAHWYLQKGLGFYSPYHPITIQGLHFTSLKGRTWLCVIMICLLPFWRLPFSKTVNTVIKGVCQILVFSTRLWFLDLFLTCLCEFKLNCTVRTWLPKNSL